MDDRGSRDGPARRYRRRGDAEAGRTTGSPTTPSWSSRPTHGAENFTWPDGGQTPFAGGKGTALEGGVRVPCILRWPGKVAPGVVENGIMSGLDWFPTFALLLPATRNIAEELKAR